TSSRSTRWKSRTWTCNLTHRAILRPSPQETFPGMTSYGRTSTAGPSGTSRRAVRSPCRQAGRRVTAGILLTCLGVHPSLVLVGGALQDALTFPASIANATPMGATPSGVEVVAVETEPGVRVEGWVLRGQGRSEASPGPAVVFFHGNAERIDNCLDHARQ